MTKTYKAKKPTITVVRVERDAAFYEHPWVKKILCVDAGGRHYVRGKYGAIEEIHEGEFLRKDKELGVVVYEARAFLKFYEEA